MYYSILEKDSSGSYLHTGRNSKTKEECINDGIDFLYSDESDEDHELARLSSTETKENILLGAGYIIDQHEEPLSEGRL